MKTTKLNNDELLDLYINQDMSSLEIAKKFKVCVSSVCRRLNKLGVIKPAKGAFGRNGKKTTVYINGYPMVYLPEHPRAKANGYVREHILVAEKYLKRPLKAGEVIHHINEDKTDNRPENLVVFASQAEHMNYHWKKRRCSNGIALPNALYVMQGIVGG